MGIATVAAAGNDSATGAMSFPACVSTTVSVGSLNKNGDLSDFSNISALTSLLAPGEAITSSIPHSAYAAVNGTSMAAASVAGAWALLRQAAPGASVDQILAALQSTGLSVTDTRSGGSVTKPSAHVVQALSSLGAAPQIEANNPGALAGAPHMTKGEMVGGSTVSAAAPATLTLTYNGMLRDRVGQGDTALGPDGAPDGTLTVTLSAPGGRTVTALRLDSNGPRHLGHLQRSTGFFALAVAPSPGRRDPQCPGHHGRELPGGRRGQLRACSPRTYRARVPARPHADAHGDVLGRLDSDGSTTVPAAPAT